MHAASGQALDDLGVVDVDLHHVVDVHAGLAHGLGLRNGARETVEQKAVGAVRLLDALLYQPDDHIVGHQRAGVHEFLGLQPERRARP